MTENNTPDAAKPRGQYRGGKPPAKPVPCTACGKVSTGHRKGLCHNCYSLALYHKRQSEKPKKETTKMPGLTEFENYVWENKDTSTIGEICRRKGCTPEDVRAALNAGILALHGIRKGRDSHDSQRNA